MGGQLGIKPKHLMLLSDALFEESQPSELDVKPENESEQKITKEITFVDFLKFVIDTRPQNPASVLDLHQMRRHFCGLFDNVIRVIDKKCCCTEDQRLAMAKRTLAKFRKDLVTTKEQIKQKKADCHALSKELKSYRETAVNLL